MRKGWEVKNFGEVCELIGGNQPPKSDFVFAPRNGYVRLIQVRDYRTDKFLTYIPKTKAKRFCTKDDIMIGRYGPPIFGIFRGLEGSYNVALMKAVVNESICTKDFFYLFLKTDKLREFVEKSSKRAAGQDGVRKELLEKYPVPVPPISEQKRIVAILDKAFAAIEKAKQNTEYNLQSAKELFESYLKAIFENRGTWKEEKLGQITTKIGSGATPRGGNESYKTEGISLVRSMNVHDRYFKERNLAFIDDKQANELKNVTLEENDVLLNITGASVARSCVMPKEYLPARVNQHVAIIRPKKEIIDSAFLNLLLTSKFYKDQLLFTGEQGATRQAITKVQLQDFTVHFPPIKEQKAIVKKLDALSAECKKLEAHYQQKLNDLEELKKSILQKAFSGELTAAGAAVEV
ncbi:MAG TPA: restriction endonuclease subunit S [Chitinophagales bacterium]|nr:restriction endonuclease subunit S [Chitinophagales bacterium]